MADADEINRKNAEEAKAKANAAAKQAIVDDLEELTRKANQLESEINGTQFYGQTDTQKGLMKAQLVTIRQHQQLLRQRLKDWA